MPDRENPDQESKDLQGRRDGVLQLVDLGNTSGAGHLLWHEEPSEAWFDLMAPLMESAGGKYEKTNKALAIWCYEQAKALYETYAAGATSGGEGMARLSEGRGDHLGKKIWLLR